MKEKRKGINVKRKTKIAELAESIATNHWESNGTQLVKIADNFSVTHCYGNYGEFFVGLIAFKQNEFNIFLNLDKLKNPNYTRTRSTFAHELGHYFIEDHNLMLRSGVSLSLKSLKSIELYNEVEQEANHFAANLLMPNSIFKSQINKFEYGMQQIIGVSDQFNVSKTSAAYHFVNKNVMPCMIIKWNNGKIERSSTSAMFRKMICNPEKILMKQNRPKTDEQKLIATSESRLVFKESIGFLSSWCDCVKYKSKNDIIVVEQSLNLGAFGGISLIFPTEW